MFYLIIYFNQPLMRLKQTLCGIDASFISFKQTITVIKIESLFVLVSSGESLLIIKR